MAAQRKGSWLASGRWYTEFITCHWTAVTRRRGRGTRDFIFLFFFFKQNTYGWRKNISFDLKKTIYFFFCIIFIYNYFPPPNMETRTTKTDQLMNNQTLAATHQSQISGSDFKSLQSWLFVVFHWFKVVCFFFLKQVWGNKKNIKRKKKPVPPKYLINIYVSL